MRTLALQLILCCATITFTRSACPSEDWRPFGGKCYRRSNFSIEALSVNDVCNFGFPGARAVSIHDLETNTFLSQQLMQGDNAWIGLYRPEDGGSGFSWLDGSALDWTYWYHEPEATGELCGNINFNHATGQWGSLDCSIHDPFICEVDDTEAADSVQRRQ